MSRFQPLKYTLTIPNGGQDSDALPNIEDAECLAIYSPGTLTGVVTVEVSPDKTGATFRTLRDGGVDVGIAVGQCVVVAKVAFERVRLHSSLAEAAARVFEVVKQVAPVG